MACGVFLPALQGGFVWDDSINVLDNARIRALTPANLWWMATSSLGGHYHPLTWLSFAADHALWGLQPSGYHLSNLLIHGANAALFLLVVRQLLQRAEPAWPERTVLVAASLAALLFAVHPLRVESVAWVTERRDVLSAFFYLLGLLAWLRATRMEPPERRWRYLALLAFAASGLAKAWVISLPAVLLLLDVYPLRRMERGRLAALLVEKLPFAVLAVSIAALAARSQQVAMAGAGLGLVERLEQACLGLCFYLLKLAWPANLSALYLLRPHRAWALGSIGPVLAVLGVTAWFWRQRNRRPWLRVAWLAYAAIASPVLGLMQSGQQFAADRYTYLSCWPWYALGAGALAQGLANPRRWMRGAVLAAASAAIVLLAAQARSQVAVWHSEETLWSHAIAVDPTNYVAWNDRGDHRRRLGRLSSARADLDTALALWPEFGAAWNNRGNVRADAGDLQGALLDYDKAIALGEAARCNRAAVRLQLQDATHALAEAREGRLREPGRSICEVVLAQALDTLGRRAEAIVELGAALERQPEDPSLHAALGEVRLHLGDAVGARKAYDRAVQLEPAAAPWRAARGQLLRDAGDLHGALGDWQVALAADPTLWPVYVDTALAWAKLGRPDQALRALQQVLARAPADWPMRAMVLRAKQDLESRLSSPPAAR